MAVPEDGCTCRWLQVTVAASLVWEWCGCCIGSPLSSHLVFQPACGFTPAVQLRLVTESRRPQEGEKSKGPVFSLNAKIALWGNFIPERPEWVRQRDTLWHIAQDRSSHALTMSGYMSTMCPSVTYTDSRSLRYRVLFAAESTAGLGVSMDGQMFVLLCVQLFFTALPQRWKHPGNPVLLLILWAYAPLQPVF